MSKSKLLLLIVCLFLVQATTVTSLDIRTYPLNLNRKVSPTETSLGDVFLKEFNILTFALGMYELDAGRRLTKEDIKERLIEDSIRWSEEFDISFC